jgi:tetratricopeptide (TPR) repeat protein
MEGNSKWLLLTMVVWLPGIFFTTYLGIYEAYQFAADNELLGVRHSEKILMYLVFPSMVPTIITGYTILNRKRNTLELIKKLNDFTDNVGTESSKLSGFFLTDSEYKRLPLDDKVKYCRDLNRSANYALANKYLEQIYSENKSSQSPRSQAIAYYAKSLVKSPETEGEKSFNNSKIAYEIISQLEKDQIYFTIMYSYVFASVHLGYEQSIELIDSITYDLNPQYQYWHLRLELQKSWLMWRINPHESINFEELQGKMNLQYYDKEQLNELEEVFGRLKKEWYFHNDKFEEFEKLIHQRLYLSKWNGKSTKDSRNDFARLYRAQGKYGEAIQIFKQLLSDTRRDKDDSFNGICLINLGKTYLKMGEFAKAETYAEEGLEIMDRLNYARGQIECLTVIVKTSDQLEKQNKDYRLKLNELVELTGIEADPL